MFIVFTLLFHIISKNIKKSNYINLTCIICNKLQIITKKPTIIVLLNHIRIESKPLYS